MNNAVIVIPVHTSNPSQEELIAFAQCYKVLADHDIFILHPEGLDLEAYSRVNPNIKGVAIDPHWLSDIKNYNKLKCSPFFYNLFSKYRFLLTYELDAFVFRDELIYWCKKGYDYIGAPWYEGYANTSNSSEIVGVGNSGFSLRNVKHCLRIIKRVDILCSIYKVFCCCNLDRVISFKRFLMYSKLHLLFKIKGYHFLEPFLTRKYIHEDIYWGIWVSKSFKDFVIAPYREAIQFSFETEPKKLYKINNFKLPFGCHAWLRYDPMFWSEFIIPKKRTLL
ncbi:hypothetical protein JAO76_16415 [Pontibacter sp. BT310]|uniref:DUF5672 domain-containing protein n=1 Tax=Pontibacter populi TaxID=890055 RepID=A0ABS6XF82_9BACT|nr:MULTISPECIES: DUF5672 family protein [Pontibacter]MBJ6119793.1 hypothetical protein [Pontibacter sp. BT310]MBR0572222.1 hypothetical protein [Microvirga sp. STS03]MBW3366646.1 hypothetical protein [Pontibacter populi]